MVYTMHAQNRSPHTLRLSSFQDIPFTFQSLQPCLPCILSASARKAMGIFSYVIATLFGLGAISSMELKWETFYCSHPPLRLFLHCPSGGSTVLCITVFHVLSKMQICYAQEAESSRRTCSVSFLHCLYTIVFPAHHLPCFTPQEQGQFFWHLECFPASLENNFNRTQLSKPIVGCIFLYWLLIKPINHRYAHGIFFAKKFLK